MIDHISVSAIRRYMDCPLQFRFAYLDKIRIPIRIRTVLGKSVHRAYEENFKYKKQEQKDKKLEEIVDYFVYDFETTIQNEEIDIGKENVDSVKDEGVTATKIYYPYAKKIIPDLVEEKFEISYKIPIVGYIDLTTVRKEIIDYKVTKTKPKEDELRYDLQRLIYSAGYYSLKGTKPSGFYFHFLRPLKSAPIVDIVPTPSPSKEEISQVAKIVGIVYNQIEYSIKTGNFYPSRNAMICSWCGYYDLCRSGKW